MKENFYNYLILKEKIDYLKEKIKNKDDYFHDTIKYVYTNGDYIPKTIVKSISYKKLEEIVKEFDKKYNSKINYLEELYRLDLAIDELQ